MEHGKTDFGTETPEANSRSWPINPIEPLEACSRSAAAEQCALSFFLSATRAACEHLNF
jgi:hypothetical protein